VSTIVSLTKPSGAVQKKCSELELTWLYHPIPDFEAPLSLNDFSLLIDEIVETMNLQKGVCVHCRAGIGRTGLVLACAVGKYLSLPFQQAISTVRRARPAVETAEQEEFIKEFLREYS
jgi:protein-tyrosine phosphatase